MVAPWKIEEVNKLKEMINRSKVIGLIDLFEMPAAQLHEIRRKFREKVTIKVSKKRLIERALKETGNEKLIEFLGRIPGIILANEDPIKIFKEISSFKVPAPAKPGVPAPKDIVIPAGPTPLPPMAMGQLKALGLKTKVEGGKITILEDKVVTKAGEIIKPEIADLVNKLGLKPLEIGLNIVALSDKKMVYDKETLELAIRDFTEDVKGHFLNALYLALGINWMNKYTSIPIIKKAYLNALALARSVLLPERASIIEHIKRAYNIAKVLNERVGGG